MALLNHVKCILVTRWSYCASCIAAAIKIIHNPQQSFWRHSHHHSYIHFSIPLSLQVTDVFTSARKINKTDAMTLLSTFGVRICICIYLSLKPTVDSFSIMREVLNISFKHVFVYWYSPLMFQRHRMAIDT